MEKSDLRDPRATLKKVMDQISGFEERVDDFDSAYGFMIACNCALLAVKKKKDPALMALCYQARAERYYKMKFFKHCLNSLELAEPQHPSPEIIESLRRDCLKAMKTQKDLSSNPHANKFKLSFAANPKLPFFIDALELRHDTIFGKCLVTTRKLKAGHVIAKVDDHVITGVDDGDHALVTCNECLRCDNCDLRLEEKFDDDVMTCNRSKCIRSYDEYQRMFGGLLRFSRKLQELVESDASSDVSDNKVIVEKKKRQFDEQGVIARLFLTSKIGTAAMIHFGDCEAIREFCDDIMCKQFTVFDFDWSSPSERSSFENTLACIMCTKVDTRVKTHMEKLTEEAGFEIKAMFLIDNQNTVNVIKKFMGKEFPVGVRAHLDAVLECAKAVGGKTGMLFHPSMLLLNHSCEPNIIIHHMENGELVWIVCRPIAAGERIFVGYWNEYYSPLAGNAKCVYSSSCEPCIRGWRGCLDFEEMQKLMDSMFVELEKSLAAAPAVFNAQCHEINAFYKKNKGKMDDPMIRKEIAVHQLKLKLALEVMEDHYLHVKLQG